jgi:hypothetical protein
MTNTLHKLGWDLETVNGKLDAGIDALQLIAQHLCEQGDNGPEGPALHFLAEGFQAQREKLQKCIDTAYEMSKADRLQAVS